MTRSRPWGAAVLGAVALLLSATAPATAATRAQAMRGPSSAQWAGPVRTGATFDRVRATFVVPRVALACGLRTQAAVWVGLGGWTPQSPLAQLGVSIDASGGVGVWSELITAGGDQPSVPVPLAVRVGDTVSLDLRVLPGPAIAMTWSDLTQHQAVTRLTPFARPWLSGPHGSGTAEWIVERPDLAIPMTGLSPVTFSAALAHTSAGRTVRPGDPVGPRTGAPLWLHVADGAGTLSAPWVSGTHREVTVATQRCGS